MAGDNTDKVKCQYGEKCYRKDPSHLKSFSHHGDKKATASTVGSVSLNGKKVVFTGVLKNGTRPQVEANARQYGCIPISAVSSKTDYVIVGSGSGTKEDIAKTYGVKTLSEDEWESLLSKCNPSNNASASADSTDKDTSTTKAPSTAAATAAAGDSDTDVDMEMEAEVKKAPQKKRKIPKVHSMSDEENDVPKKKKVPTATLR